VRSTLADLVGIFNEAEQVTAKIASQDEAFRVDLACRVDRLFHHQQDEESRIFGEAAIAERLAREGADREWDEAAIASEDSAEDGAEQNPSRSTTRAQHVKARASRTSDDMSTPTATNVISVTTTNTLQHRRSKFLAI
jgi:hypothetical protein